MGFPPGSELHDPFFTFRSKNKKTYQVVSYIVYIDIFRKSTEIGSIYAVDMV